MNKGHNNTRTHETNTLQLKPLTFCSPVWFILVGKKKNKRHCHGMEFHLLNRNFLHADSLSAAALIDCKLAFTAWVMLNNMIHLNAARSLQLWVKTVVWGWHTVLTCLDMLQLLESTLYLWETNRWHKRKNLWVYIGGDFGQVYKWASLLLVWEQWGCLFRKQQF